MNEDIVTYEDISVNKEDWWMNEVGDQFSLAQFQVDLDGFESQKKLKQEPEKNLKRLPSFEIPQSDDFGFTDSLSMNSSDIDEIMKNFIGSIPSGESENIMVDIGQISYGTYSEKINTTDENISTSNYFDMKSERKNKRFSNYSDSTNDFGRLSILHEKFSIQDDIAGFSNFKTDNSSADGFFSPSIEHPNRPTSSGGRIIYLGETPSQSMAIPRLEFNSSSIIEKKHEQNVSSYDMTTLSPPTLDSMSLGGSPYQISSSPYSSPVSPCLVSNSPIQIPTTIFNSMCSSRSTISETSSETGSEIESKKIKRPRRGQPRKEKLYNFSAPFDDPKKEKRRLDAIKSHDAREKEKKLKKVMTDQIAALEKALEEKDAIINQKDSLIESKEAILGRYKKALKDFVTFHQKIDHNSLSDLIS